MRPYSALALALLAASCTQVPPAREEPKPEPPPADEPREEVRAPEPDPLGPKLVSEADRLFTEASRLKSSGKPDEAAETYGRAIALYEALAKFDPSPALPVRAANAREGRAKALADAEAASKERWKTEILASLPPAPFPDDAAILRHFEELVSRNPEDRASRRRLAALYLADERYPEAAALLDAASDPEPVFELARAALWYRLGRNDDAVAKMEDVRLRWRRQLPLAIRRPAFCLTPPKGFDRFTPADPAFFPGQRVWVYFDVDHATVASAEVGKWRVSLRCDYEVLDEKGVAVAWPEVKDFARDWDPPAYGAVPDDVCLMLGLVMPKAARGKYTLVLKLSDRIEAKETEARMAFELK